MRDETTTKTVTTIPALPGWYVACYVEGPDGTVQGDDLVTDVIVAWEIERNEGPYHPGIGRDDERCVHHNVAPLMLSGAANFDSSLWAILTPDGVYDIPYDRTLKNKEEALTHLRSQYVAGQEWRKKKQTARGGSAQPTEKNHDG